MIYIFFTCINPAEAKRIIHQLLDRRLIACASIIPEVQSIYRWEGKIEESKESKVILKTVSKHFDAIEQLIKKLSSYDVTEIIQVEISKVNAPYLCWVHQECS